MSDRWEPAAGVIRAAIEARTFPAAVAEVGDGTRTLWRAPFGHLAFDNDTAVDADAVFDLASLTKPLATTLLALSLERRGRLSLGDTIASSVPDWRGSDRAAVTVRDLLEHAGGLAARLVDAPPASRREFAHDIAAQALEYAPRSTSIYSDLGFILLGFLLEDRLNEPLDTAFLKVRDQIWTEVEAEPATMLQYRVPGLWIDRTVPTMPLEEDRRRGQRLAGEVHDNYAAALGGVAGHAGLFGNALGVGTMARAWLRGARGSSSRESVLSPAVVARALSRSGVPGSSRALGWDTMRPTSSCGPEMSPAAFGHAGFTGVTLWIDPEVDRYFVLLTNRVCGGGTQEELQSVRRTFHTAARRASLDDRG